MLKKPLPLNNVTNGREKIILDQKARIHQKSEQYTIENALKGWLPQINYR